MSEAWPEKTKLTKNSNGTRAAVVRTQVERDTTTSCKDDDEEDDEATFWKTTS